MQEENLTNGKTSRSTIYLEPNRLAIHDNDSTGWPSLVYLADEGVLRIINHHYETVRDTTLAGIEDPGEQPRSLVDTIYQIAVDRMKTMDSEQLALSKPHLIARYCGVLREQRGTNVERSRIKYSPSASSTTASGYACDQYDGRRGDEMVSAVCSATWASLGVTSDETQALRPMPELLGSRWPGAAAIIYSGDPNQSAHGRYPGVPLEETLFCNGQAQLKTTIVDIHRTEIGADVYTAPDGYVDLTCRDQGLCN